MRSTDSSGTFVKAEEGHETDPKHPVCVRRVMTENLSIHKGDSTAITRQDKSGVLTERGGIYREHAEKVLFGRRCGSGSPSRLSA